MNAKHTPTYWCDSCGKFVEPTSHSVSESSEFWGHKSWQAFEELRCPTCRDVVQENIACDVCKEARPEPGADHCTACLAAFELAPNRTDDYVWFHADNQSEELRLPGAGPLLPDPHTPTDPAFGPFSLVEEIGQFCRKYETATHELVGQVRWIGGKPVISLTREPKPEGLDALLRRGSDLQLLRRQAG
jgi:hypothetical protein